MPCAQYISLKHLLRDLRGERIEYFDKVEKSILWLKGFGRRYIAFLGFVLVVNLLDLPSIDAQKTRGEQLPCDMVEQTLDQLHSSIRLQDEGESNALAL